MSFIIDGLQFQVCGSLIPSPTPSFLLLAVLQVTYGKQQKAGHGTGNEATLYLRGLPNTADVSFAYCKRSKTGGVVAGSEARACQHVTPANRSAVQATPRFDNLESRFRHS